MGKIKLLFSIFFVLLNFSSLAGVTETHGGQGIQIDDGIFLFDLYEYNKHLDPYIDETLVTDTELLQKLKAKFKNQDVPVELLARKISELRSYDLELAEKIEKAIFSLQWFFATNIFQFSNDNFSPLLRTHGKRLVQLALRYRNRVYISLHPWLSLKTSTHRVALIIHEALYYHYWPTSNNLQMNSFHIRKLTASLF